eukprot:2764211-Rhodomonas_salina.2
MLAEIKQSDSATHTLCNCHAQSLKQDNARAAALDLIGMVPHIHFRQRTAAELPCESEPAHPGCYSNFHLASKLRIGGLHLFPLRRTSVRTTFWTFRRARRRTSTSTSQRDSNNSLRILWQTRSPWQHHDVSTGLCLGCSETNIRADLKYPFDWPHPSDQTHVNDMMQGAFLQHAADWSCDQIEKTRK